MYFSTGARALAIGLLASLNLSSGLALASAEGFQVVVNSANPTRTMHRAQLAEIFMKKSKIWDNGVPAIPIDRLPRSPIRESFSVAVHGRAASAVHNRWNQLLFSGRGIPPEIKETDDQVKDYVRSHPGAIGYLSRETSRGKGLEVVRIED